MNRLFVLLGAVIVTLYIISSAQAELFGDYVGEKACADCHEAQARGWLTTPHAHAFADLAHQGEEKQTTPGCVKCHVVAMEADGGFIDTDLTPELINVQCESCHGPGARHVQSEDPKD
ncbi:MAG: cytochrome c family protein, partial [Desulfoplanes sp.]|nr:cytochrome c family protein [Desulfoplanes sp.]